MRFLLVLALCFAAIANAAQPIRNPSVELKGLEKDLWDLAAEATPEVMFQLGMKTDTLLSDPSPKERRRLEDKFQVLSKRVEALRSLKTVLSIEEQVDFDLLANMVAKAKWDSNFIKPESYVYTPLFYLLNIRTNFIDGKELEINNIYNMSPT